MLKIVYSALWELLLLTWREGSILKVRILDDAGERIELYLIFLKNYKENLLFCGYICYNFIRYWWQSCKNDFHSAYIDKIFLYTICSLYYLYRILKLYRSFIDILHLEIRFANATPRNFFNISYIYMFLTQKIHLDDNMFFSLNFAC